MQRRAHRLVAVGWPTRCAAAAGAWRLAPGGSRKLHRGLIAASCTQVEGSSDWFERGFVTYSNAAKTELLGVLPGLIAAHGAVSEEVALAMAGGAPTQAPVQLAVAVTGIVGPVGTVPGKPVGTVWLAWGTARRCRRCSSAPTSPSTCCR